ncbi:MAG: type II toxin-antitoxin system HicB family antitoxin [Acidobacteria bacterium]|nr:type II toxin-antitoxin system HicB family antitoxin [Acidobacteriota bacterium]
MRFRVVLEYDPEVESYSAVCPELPGCASAGETEEEARRGIEEAIRLYLSPAEIELSPTAKPSCRPLDRSPSFIVIGTRESESGR